MSCAMLHLLQLGLSALEDCRTFHIVAQLPDVLADGEEPSVRS